MTQPADDRPRSNLVFDELPTPDALADLSNQADAQIAGVIQAVLDDPVHHEGWGAFVGRCQRDLVLIAPRVSQRVGLPVRFGERVLWRFQLPSVRFLPSAQLGVRSRDDGQELLRWLRSAHPELAIKFTDLMTDTPLYAALSDAQTLGYRVTDNQPAQHHFHAFRENYQAFFNEKPSKYKNQLRKKEKTFRERFGSAFALKEYRQAEDVPAFLDAAARINRKTYQHKLFGEVIENSPESAKAYAEQARRGTYRSFVLWHDDVPLCFVLGSQGRDGTFLHHVTGYDPEWRDYAPGINCNILLLQKLYESDRPALLDFGCGDADYKRLFANTSKQSASPILIPRTVGYSLAFWIHRVSVRFNESAVAALDRIGAKDKIKRLLRRVS